MDWPMVRENRKEAVATPRSFQPTLPCIESRNVWLQKPMPSPTSMVAEPSQAKELLRSSVMSNAVPDININAPTIPVALYDNAFMKRAASTAPTLHDSD